MQSNSYAMKMKFLCRLNNKTFHVTTIYGPSSSPQKLAFFTWLMNFDTSDFDDWTVAGDFNLIRHPENRSRPRWDLTKMNMFNELIIDLDLTEIHFSGRNFTWSNMQEAPFLSS